MTDVELVVHDDAEAAARDLAERLAEFAPRGGHLALTGGSTPRRAYELAAQIARDWSRVDAWFGDDRAVPPDDERSNFRTAHETLLDRLAVAPRVHRIRGELGAAAAADEYDAELDGVTLALTLLGIGPDGHCASLFPGEPSLDERERRAVAAEPGLAPWVERVTMTIPMLSASRLVVFLATGEGKADAVRRAFAERPDAATPASLVRGERTIAVLDRAAASLLHR